MSGLVQRFFAWFGTLAGGPVGDVLPVRLGATRRAATGSVPTRELGFDQALVWVTVTLLAWGLVMVYSASIAMPENPRFARYTHTYFLIRHAMWLAMAFVAALLAFLGKPGPPASLVDAIFSESEGNPFFVREVFEYLSEEGRLFDADGGWRRDLLVGETEVPQGVRLVVGRRQAVIESVKKGPRRSSR